MTWRGPRPRKGVPFVIVELEAGHIRSDGQVRYDEVADTITQTLRQVGVQAHVYPSHPLPPEDAG